MSVDHQKAVKIYYGKIIKSTFKFHLKLPKTIIDLMINEQKAITTNLFNRLSKWLFKSSPSRKVKITTFLNQHLYLESQKNHEECVICFEPFEEDICVTRPGGTCQHQFHVECMSEWLLENESCPLCRSKIIIETPKKESNRGSTPDDDYYRYYGDGNDYDNYPYRRPFFFHEYDDWDHYFEGVDY